MSYKAINYSSKKEALAALKKMIDRKKAWVTKTESEINILRSSCSVQ